MRRAGGPLDVLLARRERLLAATNLQRLWRGHHCRMLLAVAALSQWALTIQCAWRSACARQRTKHRRQLKAQGMLQAYDDA